MKLLLLYDLVYETHKSLINRQQTIRKMFKKTYGEEQSNLYKEENKNTKDLSSLESYKSIIRRDIKLNEYKEGTFYRHFPILSVKNISFKIAITNELIEIDSIDFTNKCAYSNKRSIPLKEILAAGEKAEKLFQKIKIELTSTEEYSSFFESQNKYNDTKSEIDLENKKIDEEIKRLIDLKYSNLNKESFLSLSKDLKEKELFLKNKEKELWILSQMEEN